MAASSPYGERPPINGPFRRSFTVPARQLSVHEKAGLEKADANADILYSHPNARIVSFSPPTDSVKSTSKTDIPADTDYPVDTVETLPWRSRTETLAATGSMIIEKVRGSTNFLKCQGVMHAILRNSQCWCVDGESKFVLRVRKFQYYRIELPSTTEEDKAKVEELKKVLPTVLRFERTPCPFIRAFTVDLPDDAITPRRKGAWKRRDSSQGNPPETDAPPLRRTKVERRWSTKTPPTSYPKGGPALAQEEERGRPGNAIGMYRRGSLFESYRDGSPASLGQSDGGTDSEHADSEHDSELDNTTDRSATASPRKQFQSGQTLENIDSRDNLDTKASCEAHSTSTDDDVQETRRHGTEPREIAKSEYLDRELIAQSYNASTDDLHMDKPKFDEDVSPAESSEELNSKALRSKSDQQTVDVKPQTDREHPAIMQSSAVPSKDIGISIEPREHLPPSTSSTLQIQVVSEQGLPGLEKDPKQVHNSTSPNSSPSELDALQHVNDASETNIETSDDVSTTESDSASDSEESLQAPVAPKMLEEPHASASKIISHATEATESSSESDSESSSETELQVDSSSLQQPVATQDFTEAPSIHTETIVSIDSETSSENSSHPSSPVVTQESRQIFRRPYASSMASQEDYEDGDDLSTVSSLDSFHTVASPTQELSEHDAGFDQILALEQRGRIPHTSYRHKRELSEMTVTASSISDPSSPVQSRGKNLEDEQGNTVPLTHSSTSDTHPSVSSSVSAMQNQDGVRERLRARRSFSPLPPASTIFIGSQIRHNSGSGHMTKAILQKVIVKPIEMAIMVVHILARIASGATVNDLLSGELFKRPEHQRRVSGFADQLNGGKSGSETEDDYGLPVRGRRKSTERRLASVLDDEIEDHFEGVD